MLLLFVSLLFLPKETMGTSSCWRQPEIHGTRSGFWVLGGVLSTRVWLGVNGSGLLVAARPRSELSPETLEELKSEERLLLEGDIIQSKDRNAVRSVWPTLQIPYDIGPDLVGRTDDILAAMAMVSKPTCVSFRQRMVEKHHLLFTAGDGCASYVGFMGGSQPVFLGPGCTVGNIVHEILHALGFHHEHTRTDRERHITIQYQNILSGKEINFKERDGDTLSLPYDITSILHYGRNFFSSNGLPTIVPKKEVQDMGQRVRLSDTDIQRVRQLYNCDALQPPTKDGVMKLENDVLTRNIRSSAGASR